MEPTIQAVSSGLDTLSKMKTVEGDSVALALVNEIASAVNLLPAPGKAPSNNPVPADKPDYAAKRFSEKWDPSGRAAFKAPAAPAPLADTNYAELLHPKKDKTGFAAGKKEEKL